MSPELVDNLSCLQLTYAKHHYDSLWVIVVGVPWQSNRLFNMDKNKYLTRSLSLSSDSGVSTEDHSTRGSRRGLIQWHHPLPAGQSDSSPLRVNYPHSLPSSGKSELPNPVISSCHKLKLQCAPRVFLLQPYLFSRGTNVS